MIYKKKLNFFNLFLIFILILKMDNQMSSVELAALYERVCDQKKNYNEAKTRYFNTDRVIRGLQKRFSDLNEEEHSKRRKLEF